MGSTTTAAVLSVICASALASRRGRNLTSNGVRGKPYHFLAAPQVSAPAAAVRPWKLCSSAMTSVRPGFSVNAIFRAFSLASAPLLMKNTLFTGSFEKATSLRAARRRTSMGTALLWKFMFRAWSATALLHEGWP